MAGLDPAHKSVRVANYHRATIHNFLEILAATGLSDPEDLRPWHINHRVDAFNNKTLDEIYHYIQPGSLLGNEIPEAYKWPWHLADPQQFGPVKMASFIYEGAPYPG